MDKAIRMLRRAQSDLDMAHSEACYALAYFDAVHADKTADPDSRLAAMSLRAETLEYCGSIRETMNKLPEAAKIRSQEAGVRGQETELPPLKTAASMLRKHREGVVATSARHGHPIVALVGCLLLCAIPMAGKADTVERVIDALVQIESSGRPAVVGDNGKAVGLLQLHPIAVSEANRIAGERRWKLSDRTCPKQSRAMARTILTWHYQRGVTDPVELACRWNKPFGKTTAHYRAKVKATLAKI
jgi:soluble lytic murein transglycosylase-like protein